MSFVPGVDVSYWEAGIDWRKVRGEGIRFVFAKASEGETYADPSSASTTLASAADLHCQAGRYALCHRT